MVVTRCNTGALQCNTIATVLQHRERVRVRYRFRSRKKRSQKWQKILDILEVYDNNNNYN